MTNIAITLQEYYELKVAKERLNRLESGGVDHWVWYGESLNDHELPMEDYEEQLRKELGL